MKRWVMLVHFADYGWCWMTSEMDPPSEPWHWAREASTLRWDWAEALCWGLSRGYNPELPEETTV